MNLLNIFCQNIKMFVFYSFMKEQNNVRFCYNYVIIIIVSLAKTKLELNKHSQRKQRYQGRSLTKQSFQNLDQRNEQSFSNELRRSEEIRFIFCRAGFKKVIAIFQWAVIEHEIKSIPNEFRIKKKIKQSLFNELRIKQKIWIVFCGWTRKERWHV